MPAAHRLFLPAFIALLGLSVPAGAATWLFAAAACPPWKDVKGDPVQNAKLNGACEKDLNLIVSGMQAALGVDDANVIRLLNEEATGAGVSAALTSLAQKAQPDDRVILYINTHGGKVEADYKGYEVKDEIFAWYTTTRPQDIKAATARGDWMTARAFRDHVNKITSREIITIIEACYADAALADYINNVRNGIGERGDDWNGREAVLFSSYDGQIANFTPDDTEALFTRVFSDALRSGTHKTLFDAFEAARVATHRQLRATCAKDHSLKELVQGWSNYREYCTQMPNAWDPFGLLDDVGFVQTDFGAHDNL